MCVCERERERERERANSISFDVIPAVCWLCVIIFSREFTHRVKSVSMAKFTSQEVTALQEGGNKVDMHELFSEICQVFFPFVFLSSQFFMLDSSVFYSQHAKEIYFKELDPQRHSVPDSRLSLIYILLCLYLSKKLMFWFKILLPVMLRDFGTLLSMFMWIEDIQASGTMTNLLGSRW